MLFLHEFIKLLSCFLKYICMGIDDLVCDDVNASKIKGSKQKGLTLMSPWKFESLLIQTQRNQSEYEFKVSMIGNWHSHY